MHNAQCTARPKGTLARARMHNYSAHQHFLTPLIIVTTRQCSNEFGTALAAPIILNS